MDDFINVERGVDNSVWYVIWRGNFWLMIVMVFVAGMFVGSGLLAFMMAATNA